jgi:diaminopimelate epimerase
VSDHAIEFVKMHGAGNDYVYVDATTQPLPSDDAAIADLACRMSHRHTGIGADGLILVMPPTQVGHVRMRMFNADGSEGRMCGNGIRCVAKFAVDQRLVDPKITLLQVETASGIKPIRLVREAGEVIGATVDMGSPGLDPRDVGLVADVADLHEGRVRLAGHDWSLVSMGNPHAVAFVDSLESLDWPTLGTTVSTHKAFADGINAHAVEVTSRGHVRVLHWERGSGPTLACGTGACAVCVAGATLGLTDRTLTADLPGGALELRWIDDRVEMTGPAATVFRGTFPL